MPLGATVTEIDVSSNGAGTPAAIPAVNHAGTATPLLNVALAASAGGIACAAYPATTCLDGVTTPSTTSILNNAPLVAGDYIEITSGTVGGSAHIVYTAPAIAEQNLLACSEDLTNATCSGVFWGIYGGTVTTPSEITTNNNNNGLTETVTNAYVLPGASYVWSFDAMLGTATAVEYGVYDNTNLAFIVSPISYASKLNNSTYTRIRVPFTVPAGCSVLVFYASVQATNPGTLYLTRFQLSQGTTEKAYIKTTTGASIVP